MITVCKTITGTVPGTELRPVMNLYDVAKVGELSELE